MGDTETTREVELNAIDVLEHGANQQTLDRRLFMQLLSFQHGPAGATETLTDLQKSIQDHRIPAVVYEDVNDPRGFALLTWSEEPGLFPSSVRKLFQEASLRSVVFRPEFNMFGRTYSSGFEQDLAFWLLQRPVQIVQNDKWPWAIWYPLRRTGAFERLDRREQGAILREHATLGRAYGAQDLAHDVRLACHGLDASDNEFVIGLIGARLHPLSHVVQAMRKTRQTSEYIEQMGPFFVGRAVFRHAPA